MSDVLTVRHTSRGHSFEIEGEEALPPSARRTSDPSVYELTDDVDCLVCNPPGEMPDW